MSVFGEPLALRGPIQLVIRGLLFRLIFLAVFTLAAASAATINVGFISFDNLIPGAAGSPGVNDFSLNNLTGDPGLGGYALPPDFPALTDVSFQNSAIMLIDSQGTSMVNLGDLAPGSYDPASLEFPSTTTFSSATFTATVSPTTLQLADGTIFVVSPSQLTAVLLPSAGETLTAGTDFVIVQVSGQISSAPEPSYRWLMILAGLGLMALRVRRTRINGSSVPR